MEKIQYKRKAFILATELPDSVYVATAFVGKLPTLDGIRLDIRGRKDDSCDIVLTKNGKPLQRFTLAASIFWVNDSVYIADIDHDGRLDLKFSIPTGGSGLAAFLSTKVFLFNSGKGFVKASFLDFGDEPEYDFDHDGIFEILGKDHVYYKGHSYWAYNLYNFKGGRLINVSRKYGYPFWTKHLDRSFDDTPAGNLSLKDRMTGFKSTPGEIF